MINTTKEFKHQQQEAINALKMLCKFLDKGEKMGIEIEPYLKDKISNAIESIKTTKLKVALIGGFSEGKTSIAAAWLEKLDRTSMKISHKESSDEIKLYEVDNDICLVDTPGLFGFKEKQRDSKI